MLVAAATDDIKQGDAVRRLPLHLTPALESRMGQMSTRHALLLQLMLSGGPWLHEGAGLLDFLSRCVKSNAAYIVGHLMRSDNILGPMLRTVDMIYIDGCCL